MAQEKKNPKKGVEMRVKFSARENSKIEKKNAEWGLGDKRKAVKKMVRGFEEVKE